MNPMASPPNSLLLGEILQGAHVASTLGGIVAIRVDGLFFNNEKVTKKNFVVPYVLGGFNRSEKYAQSNWMIFPQVEGERQKANKNHHLPLGTHVSFIFRGYNPEFWGVKPSFFMVLGSKASYLMEKSSES